MTKDLNYYMNLPYRVEIEIIEDNEGGGIALSMPELGRCAVTGYGDTLDDARRSLREVQEDVISRWLKKGLSIPEPASLNEPMRKVLQSRRTKPTVYA